MNIVILKCVVLICPETARDKIISITKHTANCHTFSELTHFRECAHGELEEKRRPWFKKGTPPFVKLRNILYGQDNKNLKDLKHMTGISYVE